MSDRNYWTKVFSPAVAILVATGCGGGDGGGSASGGGGDQAAAVENPVDAATAGNISGRIVFEGAAPSMSTIDMSDESVCADKHSETPVSQAVVTADGALANVFVYVKEGLESLTFPTPSESVLLNQDGCLYVPRVQGVMAGQDITIRNSDGILHNINASPTENRGFNTSQPVNMESTRSFALPEIMVPLRCDVHGWMTGYIGVTSHPYYSVSGGDGGFDLSTLPPGDYVIEAWHERYGVQTQTVTVATGETAEIEFTFNESMAMSAVVPLGTPVDVHDHQASRADTP